MKLSDAHTVSPLLDDFSLGKPFSSHNGITCCPAIHNVTKEKYILKRISVPESQDQVEAMLFTGACQDRAAAQAYYEESVHALEKEVALLQVLSKSRGFFPFTGSQTVAKENGEIGFDLYLLSPYRITLEAYCRKNTMTHLAAVNLGIDLAAALSQSRRAGFLYLNLSPKNIFITEGRRYQLGDLGFMPMDDLAYATFPEKYRSIFTAPELFDDFSEISTTGDVYALGMVLYHIYNGGPPFREANDPKQAEQNRRSGQELPPPAYADYELAAIILKATAFHSSQRWQTPEEMGQALIAYMQKNPVNDSMIGPPALKPETPAEETEPESAKEPENEPEKEAEEKPAEDAEHPPEEETATEDGSEGTPEAEAAEQEETPIQEEVPQQSETPPEEEEPPTEEPEEETQETEAPAEEEPAQEENTSEEEPASEVEELLPKELAQEIKAAPVVDSASDELFVSLENDPELSDILSRADSILKAKDPDPVYEDVEEETQVETSNRKASWKGPITWIAGVGVLLALIVSCVFFYRNVYCIPVEKMEVIAGNQNALSVSISTPADESSLQLKCQDTYGNVIPGTLKDGIATFLDLKPNTQYTITASVDGFHKLTGTTKVTYTTENVTEITSFTAVTGPEDGSVQVNFTVNGSNEPKNWTLMYAIGEEAFQSQAVNGHSILLTGLTVGETYNLRLDGGKDVHLSGTTSISHTVSAVVTAQNLRITERTADGFTLSWDGPETPVEQWSVHCSNGAGFDQTVTVTECAVTFTGLDLTSDYSIDVTAKGMSVSSHFTTTGSSAAVKDVKLDAEAPGKIKLTWSADGSYNGPWVVQCTHDGVTDSYETAEPSLTLNPAFPKTAYTFQIQAADGTTALGGDGHSVTTPEAPSFEGFGLTAADITIATFSAPEGEWGIDELNSLPTKTDFSTGETIGFLLNGQGRDLSEDAVDVLVLLRDESGAVVLHRSANSPWNSVWTKNLYLGQLSETPQTPGTYTLEIYFNGALAGSQAITIA